MMVSQHFARARYVVDNAYHKPLSSPCCGAEALQSGIWLTGEDLLHSRADTFKLVDLIEVDVRDVIVDSNLGVSGKVLHAGKVSPVTDQFSTQQPVETITWVITLRASVKPSEWTSDQILIRQICFYKVTIVKLRTRTIGNAIWVSLISKKLPKQLQHNIHPIINHIGPLA